jgi:bacillolysin
VHFNSTIPSHAFYLAVMGGTNRTSGRGVQGVGLGNIEHMERIFYRAFVFFLGPFAQFRDARAATLQAATDLYGAASGDRAALVQAWDAVGVQ